MGDSYQSIVDVEATADEAAELAERVLVLSVEAGVLPSVDSVSRNVMDMDRLEVWTGRKVFYSMTGEDQVSCPRCGHAVVREDDSRGRLVGDWSDLMDTIGEWHESGRGDRECSRCGRRAGLNEWVWSPPWGFGYLGFTFWNLPYFDEQFVAAVSERLGHGVVHPYGRL